MHILDLSTLDALFGVLRARGYNLIAPRFRDGAIVYDEVSSVSDLPRGWTDDQGPAVYSVKRRDDDALFGYVVGPYSWKQFLYPPRLKLFSVLKSGKGFEVKPSNGAAKKNYAFIGVRACELSAIRIQDRIFSTGEYADHHYSTARRQSFIVAVNCVQTGGNCFCVSMETGPEAKEGFDLCLTEICTKDEHFFAVTTGSANGESVLGEIPHRAATEAEMARVRTLMADAAGRMGHSLDTADLPTMLNDNFEHAEWDAVAKRCLRQLHDGLPDLLLLDGRRPHRSHGYQGRSVAAVGFMLHQRLHPDCRGEYPDVHAHPVPPVADAQAVTLGRPVRHVWLRGLRPLYHLVPRRHRHHRGSPSDQAEQHRVTGGLNDHDYILISQGDYHGKRRPDRDSSPASVPA
jgi:hypothetical protein